MSESVIEDNPQYRLVEGRQLENMNPIVLYLVAAYVYYHLDKNIITDDEYDALAKKIYTEWDQISHPSKIFIVKENLGKTSSLYDVKEIDYPERIKNLAYRLTGLDRPLEIIYHDYDENGYTLPGTGRKS